MRADEAALQQMDSALAEARHEAEAARAMHKRSAAELQVPIQPANRRLKPLKLANAI